MLKNDYGRHINVVTKDQQDQPDSQTILNHYQTAIIKQSNIY